jgi:prepilin-type N-terminal cleavage/methylation domain-containing protein
MFERMREKRNEGGFTLIELLIVIIILAILAAIVVFAVGTTGKNASEAACQSDAKGVETALEAYKAQMGAYPAANTWDSLTQVQTGPNGSVGPWLKAEPSSTHYAINFNANGQVSADASGVTTYTSGDDIDGNGGPQTPCTANAT